MTDLSNHLDDPGRHIERAPRHASPFIEHFARFGFATKGLVYIVIGFLAALAPFGLRHHPTGLHGALATLLREPVGSLLLGIIAFGFATFGIWLIIRALIDPEGEGRSWQAIGIRVGWAFGGLTHFGVVIAAIHMIIGNATRDDEAEARDWTATALGYPLGRWIIAGVGVGILIYGLMQIHHGLLDRLDPRLALKVLSETGSRCTRAVCRFGVIARGVVYAMLGAFLVRAAHDFNAKEARGLGGTLRELAAEPHGRALLAVTALGLIAFGIYMFVLARYRHFTESSA